MDTPSARFARNAHRAARAEAAAWIVRLHGPHRSPELEAAFRDWLAARAENGKQFERVTEVWDAGSSLTVAGAPRLAHWKERPLRRRWTLAAALLLVACGLASWGAWHTWADPTLTTRIGEQRIVPLTDGTRISLNSGTRIRIAYNNSERRVELVHGEVYFEVAHNPSRPFMVTVGQHRVVALGTVFDVRYEAAQTAVTLLEGKVAVSDLILSPGERVTLTPGERPKLDKPRMEAVIAWRSGEVMLDKTDLAHAIAELNRYDKTQLLIDDPEIAALPISGIYRVGDSRGFAHTVAKLYELEIIEQPERITLRRAAEH